MLYLYDNAICEDLNRSLNGDNVGTDTVKVVDPDLSIDVISQIRNDDMQFPAIVVTRGSDYAIDTTRMNFTRLHKGVSTVIDPETNNIYDEKALPIDLNYNLTILATNTADQDELTREIVFKYTDMYFLTIQLPYESDRKVRFGVTLDWNQSIENTSRALEYIQNGKIYQTIVHLHCEGCVLVTYTAKKLMRFDVDDIGIGQYIDKGTRSTGVLGSPRKDKRP